MTTAQTPWQCNHCRIIWHQYTQAGSCAVCGYDTNTPANVAQHGELRSININDRVRLKPTETGWRMILKTIDDFNAGMSRRSPYVRFREQVPAVDDGGRITGQFWCLMRYFEHASWCAGAEPPFNDLEIIK